MRKIFFAMVIFMLPQIVFANTFTKTEIQNIGFSYVTYGINSDLYNIKVAISDDAVSLENLAIEYNGITAINGVFFCPADYSQCGGKNYTINERFIAGKDLSFYPDTGERGIFGWDKDEKVFIHQTKKINPEKRNNIYEGLGNFPILYTDGKNMLEHYHDVGLYDIKMKVPLARHFICSDKNNTQIIFGRTSPTSLDNLAPALYELGCWNALNLDAGNSAQYIYNGNKIISGPRDILDGIVIERVGLDVKKLESQLDNLFKIISPQYKRYEADTSIKKLDVFLTLIPKLRTGIYDKNSDDIFNSEGEKIGYQINTIDVSEIRRIYLLSGLERRIKELKEEIISHQKDIDKQKLEISEN